MNQNKLVGNLLVWDGFHFIIPLEMVVADHNSYAIKNDQRDGKEEKTIAKKWY